MIYKRLSPCSITARYKRKDHIILTATVGYSTLFLKWSSVVTQLCLHHDALSLAIEINLRSSVLFSALSYNVYRVAAYDFLHRNSPVDRLHHYFELIMCEVDKSLTTKICRISLTLTYKSFLNIIMRIFYILRR